MKSRSEKASGKANVNSESNDLARPWVEFTDNYTLTFHYSVKTSLEEGKEFALNKSAEENGGTTEVPGWASQKYDEKRKKITKVVFDPAFAAARPTTGASWFGGYEKLRTIEGIEYLNTSEMTDMSAMFYDCWYLQSLDLSNFNTEKVKNMASMFSKCGNLLSLDLSKFNMKNVTNMAYMFNSCKSLTTLDLSNLNTENVTNMSYMFKECENLTSLDLFNNFNTKNVTNMLGMFEDCTALTSLDLSNFNTKNVTNMSSMFDHCTALTSLDLSNFDTHNVIYMGKMFYCLKSLKELDITNFNTSKVTLMLDMFSYCPNLEHIYVSDEFTTDNIDEVEDMFYHNYKLPGYDDSQTVKKWKACYVAKGGYFERKPAFYPWAELSDDGTLTFKYTYKSDWMDGTKKDNEFELNKVDYYTGESSVPEWFDSNLKIKKVVFDPSFATVRPTTGHYWFTGCTNLKTIEGIEYLNTSEMTDMTAMFYNCAGLTSLDVSKFNTQKVKDMTGMFYDCEQLQSLDLSNFDTQNVTSMVLMFKYCVSLKKLDISSFNTSSVGRMREMFFLCRNLEYILVGDGFTTKNLEESTYGGDNMFFECVCLPGFDENAISKDKACLRAEGGYFDDKSAIRPWAKFTDDGTFTFSYGYKPVVDNNNHEYELNAENSSNENNRPAWYNLRKQIKKVVFDSSFAEARPKTGDNWFYEFEKLETIEGIENLNTSEMTSMYGMFYSCDNLKSLDLSGFNTQNVTNMSYMFGWCSLPSLDLSSFDTRNVTDMRSMFHMVKEIKYIHISDKFVPANNSGALIDKKYSMFVCQQDQYDALKDNPLISSLRPCVNINATAPFGTLCVPIGGKLTAGSFSGFDKLYQIKNADADKGTITMTEVTSIETGVPYVYRRDQSDNDGIITFTPDNSLERASEPSNDNSLLKGTFESIYAPMGSYILLTDGNFHPVAADNSNPVGAYRAYLDLSKTQSGSGTAALKTFRMVFSGSETTGIDSINAEQGHKTYYDLTGRKVNDPLKGNLYIVNGKKVLYN